MSLAEAWSRHVALRVGVIVGLAFVYIGLAGPAPPVQDDSIHDYSLVRLCLDGQGCGAHGTSIEGLDQGRLLVFVLAGMSLAGLNPLVQHLVFVGLSAVAVVVLAELARSLADARAGLITAALAAWAVPTAADHPLLWNPTLASLPLAVMIASCVQLARTDRASWGLGFVLGLVVAYHGHVVHLVVWPAATLLLGAAVSKPRTAWALGVVGPALGLLAFDTEVFVANASMVLTTFVGWLVPVAVLAGIPVGAWLRPRWLALPEAQRGPLALAWLGGVVVSCVGVGALVADLPFVGRYLAAAVPSIVVLAGVAVAAIERRWAQLAASALVVLFVLDRLKDHVRDDGMWSFADVGVIDELLRGEGDEGLPELGPWIRAPDGQSLVNAARVFGLGGPARAYPQMTFQLLALEPGACPEVRALSGWQCTHLDWHTSLAWAADASPWIDPEQLELCAVFADGSERCVAVEVGDPIHEGPAGAPRVVQLEALARGGEELETPAAWRQRLRVSTEVGGRRLILLARDWQLRAAERLRAEPGPAIGPRHTIALDLEPGAAGVLTIEIDAAGAWVGPATPAIVSELEPDEEAVLLGLLAN